jgi:heme/copper-type cytochrome/quinol oxidase subunit 3
MEASAHRFEAEEVFEPEPREWASRSITAAAKMWCGATAFFFAAFLFAYFYLRSLDPNNSWKIGKHVTPSGGIGVAVLACFLLSGIFLALAARRREDEFSMGVAAIVLALVGVGLQFFEYSVLGFGPTSGGYASVFFGWTATYALGALWGIYWMEINIATIWRSRRPGSGEVDQDVLHAGLSACSTCWTFFVAIGVIMFVVLYLV